MAEPGNGGLLRTPKRSALIWCYLPQAHKGGGMRIGVLLPYGTAYFRFFQTCLHNYLAQERRVGPSMRDERAAFVRTRLDFSRLRPRLVTLNATASEIWERCNGRWTVGDIILKVAEISGANVGRVQEEALLFLQAAHAQGIVNLDFPQPPAEGYAAFVRRELDGGTLQELARDDSAAREIERLLNKSPRLR